MYACTLTFSLSSCCSLASPPPLNSHLLFCFCIILTLAGENLLHSGTEREDMWIIWFLVTLWYEILSMHCFFEALVESVWWNRSFSRAHSGNPSVSEWHSDWLWNGDVLLIRTTDLVWIKENMITLMRHKWEFRGRQTDRQTDRFRQI